MVELRFWQFKVRSPLLELFFYIIFTCSMNCVEYCNFSFVFQKKILKSKTYLLFDLFMNKINIWFANFCCLLCHTTKWNFKCSQDHDQSELSILSKFFTHTNSPGLWLRKSTLSMKGFRAWVVVFGPIIIPEEAKIPKKRTILLWMQYFGKNTCSDPLHSEQLLMHLYTCQRS